MNIRKVIKERQLAECSDVKQVVEDNYDTLEVGGMFRSAQVEEDDVIAFHEPEMGGIVILEPEVGNGLEQCMEISVRVVTGASFHHHRDNKEWSRRVKTNIIAMLESAPKSPEPDRDDW